MRCVQLLAFVLVLHGLPAQGSEEPAFHDLSAEELDELLEGGSLRDVQRGSPIRAEVLALIEAPVEELAPILVDYPNIPEWAPASGEFVVVGFDMDCTYVDGTTRLPWPLSDRTWRMCSRGHYETVEGREAFVYRFAYVPGSGNIDESYGYWLLTGLDAHPGWTYVRYVVHADPGIAVPGAIVRWVTRNALPELIEGLRSRHAELN